MRKRVGGIIYHSFIIAFGLFMIYPILWMVVSSLKPESEIFTNVTSFIPSIFNWKSYVDGWLAGFDVYFKNSFIITLSVVVGAIFSSSLVAYGFARINFRFKSILFACLLITVMLPMQITLVPQYILFHKLGWVNTFLPLIVPAYIGGIPFFIFLMIQFIRGIPRELDESALMDGATSFGIFWRIILPLSKPALATVAIFAFMWNWDDFFAQLIYLNDEALFTVSLGLNMFSDPDTMTAWGPLLAMSTLSLIPQLILFMIFQKELTEGIATTGIKG